MSPGGRGRKANYRTPCRLNIYTIDGGIRRTRSPPPNSSPILTLLDLHIHRKSILRVPWKWHWGSVVIISKTKLDGSKWSLFKQKRSNILRKICSFLTVFRNSLEGYAAFWKKQKISAFWSILSHFANIYRWGPTEICYKNAQKRSKMVLFLVSFKTPYSLLNSS